MMNNIKHRPLFDTDKVCKLYSDKDGIHIKYVCTSAINSGVKDMDIFYRETPHPEFGNRYFGLFKNDVGLMITNADAIEDLEFGLVENDDGELEYSSHRRDYKQFENGNTIDGGRAYVRGNNFKMYKVKNGEFVKDE